MPLLDIAFYKGGKLNLQIGQANLIFIHCNPVVNFISREGEILLQDMWYEIHAHMVSVQPFGPEHWH